MSLNRVILFGRIVKDVDLRKTQSGISVARFTVACDRPFANKQTGERECDFIECQAWRNTAEFAAKWFTKGSAITVDGSLRNNNYEDKNGVKHYSYIVMADNIGFGGSKSENTNNQQSSNQQTPEGLNIGDFEEIISDGETPF